MAQLNGLPVFYIKVNEDISSNNGIDFISLVDCPAIETNWVAMADTKAPLKFNTNSDKQLLSGPILIPDLPIYRYDKENGEYYVVFTSEEIQKLVRKFQATQKTVNLNYQHKKNSQLSQAVVQEIWLTGSNDKSKDLGFDLPVNTAFVVTHIGDKKFWDDEIKTGNVKGFSIEGFLDMEMKKQNKIKMSHQKFEVYKQADGCSDVYIDGAIAVDNYVFSNYPSVTLVDGKKQITQYPVWQETVVLEDGTILTLKDSKILKIDKKATMSKLKLAEVMTSDGKKLTTKDEVMQVNSEVMIVAADGTESVAPDGDYTLDSGEVVTVLGGKVTAISEPEQDLSAEQIEVIQNAMSSVIKPLQDKVAALELKNAELETKLSKIPAAGSATSDKDETAKTTLSKQSQLKGKLEFLRKKDAELPSKTETKK